VPIKFFPKWFLAPGLLLLGLCTGCTSKAGGADEAGGPGNGSGASQGSGAGTSTGGSTPGGGGLGSGGVFAGGGAAGVGGTGVIAGNGGVSNGGVSNGGSGGGDVPECVPVTSRCECVTHADGINRYIDAFEDSDPYINEIDNRNGEWFQANSLTSGTPLGVMALEPTTGSAPGSTVALHFSGGPTGATTDWATIGVPLGHCYDATVYTGISFWIKGDVSAGNDTVRFSIATPPTTEASAGGECPTGDPLCYDHFGADILLTDTWTKKELTWAQMTQKGWGIQAPVGYAKEQSILAINFAPFLNTAGYDFWIDDIEFMTGTVGNCGDLISEQQFNAFFPSRNGLYTYAGFVEAAKQWPSFCNEGDDTAKKRDVAALFGHFVQETGNQTGPLGGLVHTDEIDGPSKDYCDEARLDFPCAAGQGYHGRGPMQLSWNYNYGSAGSALGLPFLASPYLVTANATNAFNAALWFWMTRQPLKSAHTQIVLGEGFGATIRTVNGPLECDGQNPAAVQNRINAYVYFCEQLGIDPGTNQGC